MQAKNARNKLRDYSDITGGGIFSRLRRVRAAAVRSVVIRPLDIATSDTVAKEYPDHVGEASISFEYGVRPWGMADLPTGSAPTESARLEVVFPAAATSDSAVLIAIERVSVGRVLCRHVYLSKRATLAHNPRPSSPAQNGADSYEKNQTIIKGQGRGLSIEEVLRILLAPPTDVLFSDSIVWAAEIPEYQRKGAAFLYGRKSAILADEMGLGKTIEAVAALRLLAYRGQIAYDGRVLIVMPQSLFPQWREEIGRWAPELAGAVRVVSGSKERRRRLWSAIPHNAVVLVGYETLRTDYDSADKDRAPGLHAGWGLVILDEAQRIKNPKTEVSREIKAIRRDRSWALTGTPLENSPADMYSILEFARRDMLVGTGRDPERLLTEFHKSCLRRRIADVGIDLPPKIIRTVPIEMGEEQLTDYMRSQEESQRKLDEYEGNDQQFRFHAVALVSMLMQRCNSASTPPYGSAKSDRLIEQLEEATANGKKSLVFSKWVKQPFGIDRIADDISIAHPEWQIRQIKGGMSPAAREAAVHDFQTKPEIVALLMTIGSGGVGLNLQSASYVFHYDRAWNPAVEAQAEGRAHRRGQQGPVVVYRYITENSIEERIDEVLRDKAELFKHYVDLPAEQAVIEITKKLSIRDLRRIFDMDSTKSDGPKGDPAWKKLEARCERLLISNGYRAERTAEGADGGIDVIARKTNPSSLALLQAKRYSLPIGVEDLRAFSGAAADFGEPADRLIFAAPSGFSADAESFAGRHLPPIELWSEGDLA